MLSLDNLHLYQQTAIYAVLRNPNYALFLDMGLGKTIVMLVAIKELIDSGQIKNALVIAPKTVAENVWSEEHKKWESVSELNVKLVMGKHKEKALKEPADVYVTNRENAAWLFTQNFQIDMLVIDESTSFKSVSSQRFAAMTHKSLTIRGKKFKRKTALIDGFKRKYILSGTPASEHYYDLYGQIFLLDKGERLGKTIGRFREEYMKPRYFNGPYPLWIDMKPGAIDKINEKIKDICLSMVSEDYLELPERTDIVRSFELTDKRYWQMENDGVIHVDGEDVVAIDTLSKITKSQQIASGFIYDNKGKCHELNSCKLELLKEMVESTDEQILVMYRFDVEKEWLKSIGGVPIDCPENVKAWQQGKIKLGLLYPESGGRGLTLTSGHIIVWFTLPLSLESYLQSNKRVHRQGQKNSVRIFHLIGKRTIDEKIFRLLQTKQDVLDGLMQYFKI